MPKALHPAHTFEQQKRRREPAWARLPCGLLGSTTTNRAIVTSPSGGYAQESRANGDETPGTYESLGYRDFSPALERGVNGLKCYQYERLPVELLPSLYLAFHDTLSEPTEAFHHDIRGHFNRGDLEVVKAMTDLAEITRQGREALLKRDETRIPRISTRRIP